MFNTAQQRAAIRRAVNEQTKLNHGALLLLPLRYIHERRALALLPQAMAYAAGDYEVDGGARRAAVATRRTPWRAALGQI